VNAVVPSDQCCADAEKLRAGFAHRPRRNEIIKIMVLLHSAVGLGWQSPPKGTSLKTLGEAEEQGFILIRGEFQKRQFRLTEKGAEHVDLDRRRLEARRS
jgi:DNA-binding PadR family transcriptional regulator